jgi:hypothetical protein
MTRPEITGRKPHAADRAKRRPGPPVDDPKAIEPTPQVDISPSTTVKSGSIRGPPIPRGAYSIPEFAAAHGFSTEMYFKLKRQGLGPKEMQVGRRRLISLEAAAEWRRAREAAA